VPSIINLSIHTTENQPKMPILKAFKSKIAAGGTKKDKKPKPLPLRLTFTEHPQSDTSIIRNFDDLYSKTVRVWRSGAWDDNVKNGATGALFDQSHHASGEGAKSRAAFKEGKLGFCLEWIDFEHEGDVFRVRCMNEFCVKSQQCTDHPKAVYKDGSNRIYDLMNWGETVTCGMIRDTGAQMEVRISDDERKAHALEALAAVEVRLAEAYQSGKDVTELEKQCSAMHRAIRDKTYLLGNRSDMGEATSQRLTSVPIYNSRTSVSNSGPGNPVLDAKARRNPNDRKKCKTDYVKPLGSIYE
jgi:hypothetical protein